MTSPFTVLVFICLILRTFIHAFETASFYGGSYIGIPLQDAKSTTDIHLRFRTKQPDAFLFLAAGKTDYCLLKLQSGKLKVHINLGAGESELSSPKGLRLDDLTWHEVILSRKDAEVKVTIDKIHNVREKLPGKYFELNIYDGLFLGGSGDSLDLFLGHFDWLRGCLSAVVYNGVDVLKRARYRAFQSDVHDVTWSCASEFDASFNSDMSFMEDGAFMSLPNPVSRIGVRWQFELKTNTEDCMLFYNSKLVQGGRNDYVGLEIVNRKLRLAMDTGGGVTEVWNEATITDGEWHLVTVQISTNTLEVVVDGKFVGSTHVTIKTGNKYLDLADIVYIGGLELNKRANALAVGMRSADKSFKGCLRSMEADGKLLGFPNAKVTQGVLPNCVWSYACSSNPCSGGASCSQYGVDSFHCECDRPPCSSSDNSTKVKPFTKSSLPIALEILSLNPVQVMEGDTIPVSTDNVNVILDYAKYGIRDSGVSFRVTQPPHHGSINIGSGNIASGHIDSHTVFTLLDLSNEKVHYVHDGSENCNDSFILDLEFTTSVGHVLPSYLEGRNLFVVSVDVAPVNDPPFLFIPSAKVFRLAEVPTISAASIVT